MFRKLVALMSKRSADLICRRNLMVFHFEGQADVVLQGQEGESDMCIVDLNAGINLLPGSKQRGRANGGYLKFEVGLAE